MNEEPRTPTPDQDELLFEWHVYSDYRDVVEALIFSAEKPLSTERVAEIIDKVDSEDIERIISMLNQEYSQQGRAFEIVRLAGGYCYQTRAAYAPYLRSLLKVQIRGKLSQPALETLAVVAYKQPVTKAEIESLRGVSIEGSLRTLLDRNLLRITGRRKSLGRPLLYGTTDEFLKYFGIDSIDDLPKMKEIEAILSRPREDETETE